MTWGQPNHVLPPRSSGGVFMPMDAMARFREKCLFDPKTGCVLWTGAKSWGRGKSIRYGGFKYQGQVWLAHRWAAKFIHGHDIDGLQVDHCCPLDRAGTEPLLPNHLCVEHLAPVTGDYNRWLQTERRRHFIHVEVGLTNYEDVYGPINGKVPFDAIPFYEEPAWMKDF